jgi:proton-dependent oligopeptide transporter, POT family
LILSFFSIFFWTAFEQAGSSMNVFADRYVDRMFGGFEIPASIFQSINPIFILIFAPVFAKLWSYLSRKKIEPGSPEKFSLGLVLLSLGFMSLVIGSKEVSEFGRSSMLWLVLAYLLNTWGELCLSPVGLSMVSKLSPQRMNGILMGIWLLSNAVSHMIGGVISGYMDKWGADLFFLSFTISGIIAAILLFGIRGKLSNMSGRVEG